MKHVLASLAFCFLSGQSNPDCEREDPVEIFAELDGIWEGEFVGWDPTGNELYRIQVRQEYRIVDANTQRVKVEDRMPDGTVIHGEGENTARIDGAGNLDLRCVVRKSNGETVEHSGRTVRGSDGKRELVWYSVSANRSETFREWVESSTPTDRYHIQGMGRYSDSLILMSGCYRKVED